MHVENITSNAMSLDRNGQSMLIQVYEKEIDRLNNIINELEKYLYERFNVCRKCQIVSFKEHNNYSAYNGELLAYKSILDKLKELKENNK